MLFLQLWNVMLQNVISNMRKNAFVGFVGFLLGLLLQRGSKRYACDNVGYMHLHLQQQKLAMCIYNHIYMLYVPCFMALETFFSQEEKVNL